MVDFIYELAWYVVRGTNGEIIDNARARSQAEAKQVVSDYTGIPVDMLTATLCDD